MSGALDHPIDDVPSLTLPDWRGALARVKGRFRRPPKPPWRLVMAILGLSVVIPFLTRDVLGALGIWASNISASVCAAWVVYWVVIGAFYVRVIRHEWVAWRNEWRDKAKPVPSMPGYIHFTVMVVSCVAIVPISVTLQ